jgi:hypothetical protein
MSLSADTVRRSLPGRAAVLFLLGAAVFAAAYCQAPLYYSNQNQYFLHGAADAGVGLLSEDWLAKKTRDPCPLFSGLVTLTLRFLHPAAFYLYYGLVLGIYAAALFGLFVFVAGKDAAARRWPIFAALVLLTHAALPRWCSCHWLGYDYHWFLQAGVAGQYLLGPVFQPSVFGILLVVAVCLFVHGRPYLAAACAALGATVHTTYLLPAGLLTLGFTWSLWAEGRPRRAVAVAALALVLVLPVLIHVLVVFGPTDRETFARAQDILVNVRIPHHTRPGLWFDAVTGFQLAWMVLALVLVRRSHARLFTVLAAPFLLGLLLTLTQVATGSNTLALLFPWRVSAVLVPVATAVILARVAAAPWPALDGTPARAVAAAVVAALVAGGLWIMTNRQGFRTTDQELLLLDFVRRNKEPGDVYFLRVSAPQSKRGALSSDFLPEKKIETGVIPYDLQRFRLTTGAPIFVDFKSVPYKDVEVLEWYDRFRAAKAILEDIEGGRQGAALEELRRRGVTHLILKADQQLRGLEGEGVGRTYKDEYYQIYRLK